MCVLGTEGYHKIRCICPFGVLLLNFISSISSTTEPKKQQKTLQSLSRVYNITQSVLGTRIKLENKIKIINLSHAKLIKAVKKSQNEAAYGKSQWLPQTSPMRSCSNNHHHLRCPNFLKIKDIHRTHRTHWPQQLMQCLSTWKVMRQCCFLCPSHTCYCITSDWNALL